jgi:hypothetical protein
MSTTTYSPRQFTPAGEETHAPKAKPFWRRVYEGVIASQQRRAEREIVAYLESHGGVLNDEAEREIMRRLSSRPSFR